MKTPLDVRTERRFLTILFCDMIDSTSHQYNMDPEQFGMLLATYRQIVFRQVKRHRGHIARVIGDGILAFFGWPQAIGKDAEMAVICALEIGRELAKQAEKDPGLWSLAARMGIETGWVLVGDIGPSEQVERDGVVGPAPNIASRLQHLARRNGVVAGEKTLSLLPDWILTEAADTGGINLPAPIRAAHVRGISDRGAPLARLQPSQSAPLVDREVERGWLGEKWRLAASGAGQVVLMSGEPGVGKSRLVGAFLDSVLADAHHCLVVFCAQQSVDEAFHPLVAPLRRALDLQLDASSDEILAAASRMTRQIKPEAAAADWALAALLGASVPESISTTEIRRSTFNVLNRWIAAQAASGPLALVIEDFQWADPSFATFVEQLAARIADMPLLLLITHRADHDVEWAAQVAAGQRQIGPLAPADAVKLAATMLNGMSSGNAEMIAARAEGMPLYIEEFARTSRDSGHRAEQLPAAISQLLAARLDTLGTARRLAQLAAVMGDETPVSLLAQIAGISEEECLQQSDLLLAKGIMTRRLLSEGMLLSFRHVLLREAAYQALPTAYRTQLHGLAADHLRRSNPQLEIAAPAVLGRHLERANRPVDAAEMFRRAASIALSTGAYVEAEAHARRAVRLVETSAHKIGVNALYSGLALLGEALIATRGEGSSEMRDTYERAAQLALRARAMTDLPRLVRGLCASYHVRGPLATARQLGELLLRLSRRTRDDVLIADAERRLGWCLACQGDLAAAVELLEQSVKRASKNGPLIETDTRVRGLSNLAILSAFCAGTEEIGERIHLVASAVEEQRNPLSAAYGYGCLAITCMIADDSSSALQFAARSGQIAIEHGLVYWIALAQTVGSWAETRLGSAEVGLVSLQEGLVLYRQSESFVLLPIALAMLADAEARVGSIERALAALDEGDAVIERLGAQTFKCFLLMMRAQVLLRAAQKKQARAMLERAIREANAIGAAAIAGRAEAMLQTLRNDSRLKSR